MRGTAQGTPLRSRRDPQSSAHKQRWRQEPQLSSSHLDAPKRPLSLQERALRSKALFVPGVMPPPLAARRPIADWRSPPVTY